MPTGSAEGPATGGAFPSFRRDDIEATRESLVLRGVECGPIDSAPALSWFLLADPFGNRIDVREYGDAWLP